MGIGVEIVVEQEGEVYVVSIEGRMDATTSPVIEKKLAGLLEKAQKIIVDFSDIVYLSSAGMRLLLFLTKKMDAKGGVIAFYGMNEDVFEIIKIAGFEKILKIASTKKEALKFTLEHSLSSGAIFEDKELSLLLSRAPLPLKQKVPSRVRKKKVIVISGPTAVGKTRHSLVIAKAIGGEIVSADSMQVYRGMDIGTAKVSEQEREVVPHHLIDVRNLNERFNVKDFYDAAHKAIRDIHLRGKVPIVVGGTGFYLHGLIYGPPQGPSSDPDVREQLEEEMEREGTETLYNRLKEADPEYAKTITDGDRHKIIRALEIISLTDKKVSDFPKMQNEQVEYDYRAWFLYMPKEILYPNIEMRCDEMIAHGFIDEVRELDKQGLRKNTTAFGAIGYRQCLEFLDSQGSPDDFEVFIASFKRASRRYAKKQFTWFRKEPLFRWLNVENLPLEKTVESIIQDYELSF